MLAIVLEGVCVCACVCRVLWPSFVMHTQVSVLRGAEVALLRAAEVMSAANIAIFQSAPLLASVAMFAVYTLAVGRSMTPAGTV